MLHTLGSNIRQKPSVIDFLPGIGRNTCHAIYPNIYLSRSVYANLDSKNANPYTMAVILHEQEHLKRMKEYGVVKWYIRYALSRKFRMNEEIAALKPQFAYIKAAGLTIDLERKAHGLSSWLYLWAGNHNATLKTLTRMWQSL